MNKKKKTMEVRRRSTTRTTRSSSLFGACCQRGVNLVDGSPYLFIFIYLVTIFVIELVDM
jgi:hypothetical protein